MPQSSIGASRESPSKRGRPSDHTNRMHHIHSSSDLYLAWKLFHRTMPGPDHVLAALEDGVAKATRNKAEADTVVEYALKAQQLANEAHHAAHKSLFLHCEVKGCDSPYINKDLVKQAKPPPPKRPPPAAPKIIKTTTSSDRSAPYDKPSVEVLQQRPDLYPTPISDSAFHDMIFGDVDMGEPSSSSTGK